MITGALTTEQRDFLRRSQCGREGTNPLVCCPNTFTLDDLPSNKHCGIQAEDKITGGTATSISEFPWYVFNLSIKQIHSINKISVNLFLLNLEIFCFCF